MKIPHQEQTHQEQMGFLARARQWVPLPLLREHWPCERSGSRPYLCPELAWAAPLGTSASSPERKQFCQEEQEFEGSFKDMGLNPASVL